MDEQKKLHHKERHVKWDQDKLKQTEKYRGTFQKISQPKTPYRGNSDEQQQEMEAESKTQEEIQVEQSLKQAQKNRQVNKHHKINLAELNAKLKQQMEKFKQQNSGQMQNQQIKKQQSAEEKKKHDQFKKRRAAHYNQFKMIQQAKNSKWEQDSDDQ